MCARTVLQEKDPSSFCPGELVDRSQDPQGKLAVVSERHNFLANKGDFTLKIPLCRAVLEEREKVFRNQ